LVRQYPNVSILGSIGAKDDGCGGDNWSYKTCEVPVESSPPLTGTLNPAHSLC